MEVFNMNINITRDGNELTVELEGRLDTLTSPDLEEELEDKIEGIEKLVFDLGGLEYISSAGLRVLVGAAHAIDENDGDMVIRNLTVPVRDVFDVTGFSDAFDIE
jgi:anti-sigma B factor antagonist